MSRLGDLIHLERTRRDMTPKQVAKLCGFNEKYIVEVEAGKRIIADDQARRILKRIGLEQQTEADFSLDDIAATMDLKAAGEAPIAKPVSPKEKPILSLPAEEGMGGGIFLDALAGVLRQIPIYNAAWQVTGHRTLPMENGRIEGGAADKVLYFCIPDDTLRGFRILSGDLLLVVPAQSPIDGALMLLKWRNHCTVRKVRLDGSKITLQSYDREYVAEIADISELVCIGRCVRLEATL